MKVDNVLILAAGKGTRMGEVGKVVPKVIWPIFNRSILELEVLYAKSFSPSKIFINLYNHKEKVLEHIEDSEVFSGVTVLEEKEVLDIGGAVHNLARTLNYTGNLLILNSDQFIMLDESKKNELLNLSKESDLAMLVYNVDPKKGYSGLDIKDGKIERIISKEESKNLDSLITYTGMCVVNLKSLTPKEGKSAFFESVANFKKNNISCLNMEDSIYWDFGTIERYTSSIEKLRSSKDSFTSFLEKCGVDKSKMPKEFRVDKDKILFKT